MRLADRTEAGRLLARRLTHLWAEDPVVLGLPRGGVPVAAEVAAALDAPLDVVVVRKLGVPWQPELAMGAVGEDGAVVHEEGVLRATGVTQEDLRAVERAERAELERRVRRFREHRDRVRLDGRTVVVVDDGVATGSTARAACRVVRALGARRVVLAVPVAPEGWERRIGADADELVALATPERFGGVGQFYVDFRQTTDEEVVACLDDAVARQAARPSSHEIRVRAPDAVLHAVLAVPPRPVGLVVFAHGSGSSRHSPRNRYVAEVLGGGGLATVLADLLTEEEGREQVFDVPLLARRLRAVVDEVRGFPGIHGLPVGLFGASTGAAAALWAAAEPDADVRAIVSRGGRPDLAGPRLHAVRAPTLLIVGGADEVVLDLNERARALLVRCETSLEVVPGAGHLFAEPGTLEQVAVLSRAWFLRHLAAG